MLLRRFALVVASCTLLSACGSCSKRETNGERSADASAPTVAETLPRCRGGPERAVIPGQDVVVGDASIGPDGLLVGVVRSVDGERVGSIVRASLDLGDVRVVDVGAAYGDDPPPSPRSDGRRARVVDVVHASADGGPRRREVRVRGLDESGIGRVEASVPQQADESTAFDVAWDESGAGLVAWDEDAPSAQGPVERGLVKVQSLRDGARPRIVSPASSDAESPRLLARPSGGFWLAWLARRTEPGAYAMEGPGEPPAFRWVEAVALSAQGEPVGVVRRVSTDKGRGAWFDLARRGSELVVVVQDEAASSEGSGARIVAYVLGDENAPIVPIVIVDGGVDQALADLVPVGHAPEAPRWLAWTDTSERTHLAPFDGGFARGGAATLEPELDGARVLAAAPPNVLFALVGSEAIAAHEGSGQSAVAPEARPPALRRFACGRGERGD